MAKKKLDPRVRALARKGMSYGRAQELVDEEDAAKKEIEDAKAKKVPPKGIPKSKAVRGKSKKR